MTQKKRKARDDDRATAQWLALTFRSQERLIPSVDDDGNAITLPLTGDDLAGWLLTFAQHGTFHPQYPAEPRDRCIRAQYARMPDGTSQTAAIAELMRVYAVKEQTVRDAIYPRKKKQ